MTEDIIQLFRFNLDRHGHNISANNYDRLHLTPSRATLTRHFGVGWSALKVMALGVSDGLCGVVPDRFAKMTGLFRSVPANYQNLIANLCAQMEYALTRTPTVKIKGDSPGNEAAVILLSDWHSGKKVFREDGVETYNKDICAMRMSILTQKVIHLITNHLRPGTIDEIYLLLLGDIADGSGIYPTQEINQDLTCFVDQVTLIAACIWNMVRQIRSILKVPIRIEGVPGNHGRQSKFAPVNNNFDYLVYQLLYMLAHFEDGDVTVDYSTTATYRNVTIKGHPVHLRHMAPAQTETAASRAKFGGWHDIHKWDIMCYGHLHHPGNGSWGEKQVFMNASPIGQDDLSELMGVRSRPSQAMFGVDPGIGVSFKYDIYLDDDQIADRDADSVMDGFPMLKTG